MKTNFLLFTLLSFFVFMQAGWAQTATQPIAGDGSSGSPYQIASLENLYWITAPDDEVASPTQVTRWAANYIQTADIDASTTSGWFSNVGWLPIGNATTQFSGEYDGQGYAISSLYINRSSTSYIGLFGYTKGTTATISNMKLTNVDFTGENYVGGIVGRNENSSTISTSYSTGSVSGSTDIGGLAGYNYAAAVSNSYSMVIVSGYNIVGGLVGFNDNGSTISNSYSTGSVSGTFNVGGLVGFSNATISTSFWDVETDGIVGNGSGDNNYGATGKTTTEMKTLSTFDGWDFTTIWQMIGTNYPDLQLNSNPALPVELTSFTGLTVDGKVELSWTTATEVNNYGFEIQKSEDRSQNSEWEPIGFVLGHGTTNSPKEYSFTDSDLPDANEVSYRLKQIDNDGTFAYSKIVTVDLTTITDVNDNGIVYEFALGQNYPNPFNPATTIRFSIASDSRVNITVSNVLGQLVMELVNDNRSAGNHEITFNANDLATGVYLYKINAVSIDGKTNFTNTRKMILMK